MSFIGSLARMFSGNIPSINAITGVGYLFSSEQPKAKFLRWALSPVFQMLWLRAGTTMLFQNLDDRAIFTKRGLSAENAPLISGSGVDDDKFRPVTSNSRFEKNDRPLVIGCASRLLRDKGIPELVEAVKIVEENCDIELRIAGNIFPKNPSSCTLRDLEKWSKISSVRFLGEISDMVDFWQGCDWLFCRLIERASQGIIGSCRLWATIAQDRCAGGAEIVLDGVNGLLFAKKDHNDIARKIEKMSADHEFRQSAGKASREVIKKKGLTNHDVEAAFIELFVSTKTRAASANYI